MNWGPRGEEWIAAMKVKGHSPVFDDEGDIDPFVYESHFCNGPGCAVCGWSCCWHCKEPKDIPECNVIEGQLVHRALETS